MISRIGLSIVVGVIAFLICLFLGAVLGVLSVPVLSTIGAFLTRWAVVIGVLAAFGWFFAGRSVPWGRP